MTPSSVIDYALDFRINGKPFARWGPCTGTGGHFYTTSAVERDNAIAQFGYQSEGTSCYVFGEAPQSIGPLYRMLSDGVGKHFFTASLVSWARN